MCCRNQKNQVAILKILFLLLASFVLTGRTQQPKLCFSNDENASGDFERDTLNVLGKDYAFKTWAIEEPVPQSLYLPEKRLPEAKIKNMLRQFGFLGFGEKVSENFKIIQLVLLVPADSMAQSALTREDIKGMLIYFSDSGALRAKVYKTKNKQLELVENLGASPKAVTANSYWLAGQLFQRDKNPSMASIVISSTEKIPKAQMNNPFKDDFIEMLQEELLSDNKF